MVKMIHRDFGTEMWVAEERVNEYIAAGHKPAVVHTEKPKEEPKKRKKV